MQMEPNLRLAAACRLLLLVLFCHTAFGARSRSRTLEFYFHDYLTATNFTSPTAKFVAGPAGAGNSYFGSIVAFDDKLTITQDFNSEELGRGRGFYLFSSLDGRPISFLFSFTVEFTNERYNGSTISIFGLVKVSTAPSTLSVIGGTKDFDDVRGTARWQNVVSAGSNAVDRVTLKLVYPNKYA